MASGISAAPSRASHHDPAVACPVRLRIGVIPAAGRGVRAYPKTSYIPKPMVHIGGKPILQWNIELLRDQLGIRSLYIIIGYLGDQIRQHFGDGSAFGVEIHYVVQEGRRGIGGAIESVKGLIDEPFVVILGDELYLDSNHAALATFPHADYDAICGFVETHDREKIRRNYSGEFADGRITRLIEKPADPATALMGCGTYVLTPKVFSYIERTNASSLRNEVEITDVLSAMAQEGTVYPFIMQAHYVNITDTADMNHANYVLRHRQFKDYRVSLVIPAYNEAGSIARVVADYRAAPIHEILVVDNNSTDGTAAVAEAAGARVIRESRKGYGCALRAGLDQAIGEIVLLTEADGTFKSKDVPKLLEYLKDADMVIGTRTTRQMIEQGANMDWFLRWGNVVLGKIIQLLWWNHETRFTDVGCTFRGVWKDSYKKFEEKLEARGPEFSPEMMIEALRARMRVIEIPVSYYKRDSGESKHSVGVKKLKTGFRMLGLMLRKRLER